MEDLADAIHVFQSTFPHGERRSAVSRAVSGDDVSIHVPARGTTVATAASDFAMSSFNPRSRTGNDNPLNFCLHILDVSIHVPARGTTLSCVLFPDVPMFQSTFPHGERPISNLPSHFHLHVSIHVPARGTTPGCFFPVQAAYVSIHVPARGTTAIIHKFPLCFLLLSMQLYQ